LIEHITNQIQTIDFLGQAPGILNSQTNQSFTSSGNVYSGNLNRKFDWGSIDLNAGHQLSPASTNGQRNTTNFSADTRYNLSERWVTALAVNYVNTEQPSNLGGNLNNDSRTNVTFTPSLQWRWTPEMNLRLSYSYRQLELGSLNETAESNNVQLQFSYQPQINRQVK
jgi:long-subunit fatty acid transport protein